MTSMGFTTTSCIFALVLVGLVQQTEADSFMENWLAGQQAKLSQIGSSSAFNQDVWLARQHPDDVEEVEEGSSADSSSQGSLADASGPVNADGTLSHGDWAPAAPWEQKIEDLEGSLLSDIEKAHGAEHRHSMESRIVTIEETMRPMFKAMPKNDFEKLGHSSVRYMLHRFFVDQHGWSIDGLFTEGAALNASSPSHALKGRVPMFVEGIFEKRLGGRGFGLHDMAVLAAVVEDSIHQEAQGQLTKTYKALGLDVNRTFTANQTELFVELYMSGFIMETNMSAVSATSFYKQHGDMVLYYPTWPRAQAYFRSVQKTHSAGKKAFSFAAIAAIVKELVDTFGIFHGKQCMGLKSTLKEIEGKGSTGCIGLPAFYEKGLKADSNWMFIESPEYLRQVGSIDETDPKNPRLLAANYINSPSNCLQPTGYYMVCCHNECDDILGQLEKQLGQPSASPAEITKALKVTSLRSGNRMLSPALRKRLEEVADHHEGRVPIHGRLFAQWLHHVYPHECAYPHVSGSKHPQWVVDFEEETGKSSALSDTELKSYLDASKVLTAKANKTVIADAGSCAPWQDQEELFAPLPHLSHPALHALEDDPHVWQVTQGIAFLAALSTFTISIMRTCKSVTKVRYQSKMLQV